MKAVTIYETDDGARFDTRAGAEAHERTLKHAAVLTELLHRFDSRCWDEGGGLDPETLAYTLASSPSAAAGLIKALEAVCEGRES